MRQRHLTTLLAILLLYTGFSAAAVPCVPPEYLLDLPKETRYRDGAWSFSFKGGIAPTWFLTRSKNLFFEQPSITTLNPFSKRLDEFHEQWDMPWFTGGELTYVTCNRIEFFAEGEYGRAESKRYDKTVSGLGEYGVKYTDFMHAAGYGGIRLYSSSFWCCKFTAFAGGKLGILYRSHATGDWRFTRASLGTTRDNTLSYKQGYVPSGGLQVGINYEATSCMALVLKCETLLSGGWETDDVPLAFPGPFIVLGKTGPVLSFPISLGVRFNF